MGELVPLIAWWTAWAVVRAGERRPFPGTSGGGLLPEAGEVVCANSSVGGLTVATREIVPSPK